MMKTKFGFLWIILALGALVLAACDTLLPVTAPGQAATQVQQTVQAILTQNAFETIVVNPPTLAVPTQSPVQSTATPWVITATPVPATQTPLPSATNTPAPTVTPFPTATFAPTATPAPCNWLSYVTDVTVPDGTSFMPGETFVKTWRIKNIGSCSWVPGYALVFSDGNGMNGVSAVTLNSTTAPGQTLDVSVTLTAPNSEGEYTGNWKMRTNAGVVFGGGANANKPFWVNIKVKETLSEDPKKPYVLVLNYCAAEWRSNSGVVPCPTKDGSTGAVYRVNEPVLEGGYKDDEPAIVMVPGSGDGGMIQGKFPSYEVKRGDQFKALVGCLDGYKKCDAMIQLNYSLDGGSVQNMGTWTQTHDGSYQRVEVDLSPYAGQKIQFYLVVYNNSNSTDDRIFWLLPHVYNPYN